MNASKAAKPPQYCVQCSSPASLHCSGCKGADGYHEDDVTDTTYCSSQCQKAHWEKHKTRCKARQQRRTLYRVGNMVQKLYYAFRVQTWERKILKIEEEQGRLVVTEKEHDLWEGPLIEFPHHVCKTERIKQSLLVHDACDDGLGYMVDIFKIMINGVYSGVRELRMDMRNPFGHMIVASDDPSRAAFPHAIWEVTLKSGDVYAVDIAGAQYGYYEPVVPIAKYMDHRVIGNIVARHFGYTKDKYPQQAMTSGGLFAVLYKVNSLLSEVLTDSCGEWEKSRACKLPDMLKLGDKAFEPKEGLFFAAMERILRGCRTHVHDTVKADLQKYRDAHPELESIEPNQGLGEERTMEEDTQEDVAKVIAQLRLKGVKMVDLSSIPW